MPAVGAPILPKGLETICIDVVYLKFEVGKSFLYSTLPAISVGSVVSSPAGSTS